MIFFFLDLVDFGTRPKTGATCRAVGTSINPGEVETDLPFAALWSGSGPKKKNSVTHTMTVGC